MVSRDSAKFRKTGEEDLVGDFPTPLGGIKEGHPLSSRGPEAPRPPHDSDLGTFPDRESERAPVRLHRRDGPGFRREPPSGRDAIPDLPETGISTALTKFGRNAS